MSEPLFYDNNLQPGGWLGLRVDEDQSGFLRSVLTACNGCIDAESGFVRLSDDQFSPSIGTQLFEEREAALRKAVSEATGQPVRSFLAVERVYCLDWDQFDDECWSRLALGYERLPEWKQYRPKVGGCPYWFGLNDNLPPHLWASVEPPGLQVAGMLSRASWDEWHEAFLHLTKNLPWRSSE